MAHLQVWSRDIRVLSGVVLSRTTTSVVFQYRKRGSPIRINEVFAKSLVVGLSDLSDGSDLCKLLVRGLHKIVDERIDSWEVVDNDLNVVFTNGKRGSFSLVDCVLTEEINPKTEITPSGSSQAEELFGSDWKS
jgi:hypothetical protein